MFSTSPPIVGGNEWNGPSVKVEDAFVTSESRTYVLGTVPAERMFGVGALYHGNFSCDFRLREASPTVS